MRFPRVLVESENVVTTGKFPGGRFNVADLCVFMKSKDEEVYLRWGKLVACEKYGAIILSADGKFESRGINNMFCLSRKIASLYSFLQMFKHA